MGGSAEARQKSIAVPLPMAGMLRRVNGGASVIMGLEGERSSSILPRQGEVAREA